MDGWIAVEEFSTPRSSQHSAIARAHYWASMNCSPRTKSLAIRAQFGATNLRLAPTSTTAAGSGAHGPRRGGSACAVHHHQPIAPPERRQVAPRLPGQRRRLGAGGRPDQLRRVGRVEALRLHCAVQQAARRQPRRLAARVRHELARRASAAARGARR
eukprot:scaffold14669_cov72-Phaeocystis_antarctica.AAC.5